MEVRKGGYRLTGHRLQGENRIKEKNGTDKKKNPGLRGNYIFLKTNSIINSLAR
jgi:hypothetical protein